MAETKVLFRGIPTEPDRKKLTEAFGVPTIGTVITYAEIEKVIGCDWRSNRWQGVVTSWRKQLFKIENVLIIPTGKHSFEAANPSQRIKAASDRMIEGKKKIVRGSTIATTTGKEGLTQEEARTRDHLAGIPARLRLAEITSPKSVE